MQVSDILQQLNEAATYHRFPAFETYYPIDVRLSAYRKERQWALVLELFAFIDGTFGHSCPCTMVYCYGDDLPSAPGLTLPLLAITADGPSGTLFDPSDPIQQTISPTARDMRIRGRVAAITTDPTEYDAAGIELKRPPRVFGYELLRLISPKYRRLFFATEAEIIDRIGEPMPLLLRLSEWRHPDRDKNETPADSESFQMIADVIAHNDPSLYQPTEPPNTHWSNWPMAGTI